MQRIASRIGKLKRSQDIKGSKDKSVSLEDKKRGGCKVSSCLLEEPGELPPVVPLDPRGRAVVEPVHADVFVVVAAEDLGHEKPVREIAATIVWCYLYIGR